MTFDEAVRLRLGDRVYTHSGNTVVIVEWHQSFDNPCVRDDLYFRCVDTQLNTVSYRYNELCGPELCDEDKMFIDWLQGNDAVKTENIPLLKQAFMSGFSCGFSHKLKITTQEQLQK